MKNGVRTCGFSYSGNIIMYTTDKTMGLPCEIHIFDARDSSQISKYCVFYAPPQKVAGYYVIPSELLSVRQSVRLSVRPSSG